MMIRIPVYALLTITIYSQTYKEEGASGAQGTLRRGSLALELPVLSLTQVSPWSLWLLLLCHALCHFSR